jgi:hypothetical protein
MPHSPSDEPRARPRRLLQLGALPRIVNLTTRLATYDVPKIFFVGPERKEVRRALEITIQTDGRIPVRAISPVLWLGDAAIAEMEKVGINQYRFYAIEPSRLRDGAAIAFGWPEVPPGQEPAAQRVATNFRLRLGAPGAR